MLDPYQVLLEEQVFFLLLKLLGQSSPFLQVLLLDMEDEVHHIKQQRQDLTHQHSFLAADVELFFELLDLLLGLAGKEREVVDDFVLVFEEIGVLHDHGVFEHFVVIDALVHDLLELSEHALVLPTEADDHLGQALLGIGDLVQGRLVDLALIRGESLHLLLKLLSLLLVDAHDHLEPLTHLTGRLHRLGRRARRKESGLSPP
mmetsp:Transcript_20798/g.19821  ORF Transcript_20798/g.19821 Transcript_20798/m.19821 type:complete len:203 (-) Transcript_20798:1696-2304(-)